MVKLPDAIAIPQQLILAGARFVLLAPRSKTPTENDWGTTNNYSSDDQKLQAHITAGGNYGVLSQNGLCCIDIDNKDEFAKYAIPLPKTFVVGRGNTGRGHIYFTCPDCPSEMRTKHNTTFGDIRLGGNFQTVGANCIHPEGDTYNVIQADLVAEIPWATISRYLEEARERLPANTDAFSLPNEIREGGRNNTLFKYGLSLLGKGVDHADVIKLVRIANKERCKPDPLPQEEIDIVCNQFLKYKRSNVVIATNPFPVPQEVRPPQVLQEVQNVNVPDIPANYIRQTTNRNGVTVTSVNAAAYAEFLKDYFSVAYFNKIIYIYDHGNHLYRPQTNEIETHIRNTCVLHGVTEKLQVVILEVKTHLTSMGCYTEYPFNTSTTDIPVENGIVRINYETEEISLLSHSPEHLFTYKLAVKYNPNVKNCAVTPLLERMVDKKYIRTLVQIPAQALLQMQTGHSYKKAYLLQGEPNAGKTSYLKLLYRLFGDEFTTGISLQQLCENHFVGGTLEGKLLNIYDDLEDVALSVIDQFKTFTGDCRHAIERKYEAAYTGKITAVHIFTCNYPPEYPEKVRRDAAFWARWEYLKFPNSYPVNPNFYTEWYTDERVAAFFNMIISAMIVIRKRGLLANSDVQEVMQNWSINSDPLYEFIGSIFEPQNGLSTTRHYYSKAKLYNEYILWCDDNDIPEHKRKPTIKAFTIALQGHQFIPERKKERGESYETYSTTTWRVTNAKSVALDYHANLGL